MYGADMGALNVYLNITNMTTLLWTQYGNKGNKWFNGQVSINSKSTYRIIFEAVRGYDYQSDAALDDIDIIEKPCYTEPSNAIPQNQVTIPIKTTTKSLRPTSSEDCTFETGMCMWSNLKTNNFDWTRVQGIQGSTVQGPIDTDQTLGTAEGWYLYANLVGRKPTDVAAIEIG